MSCSIHEVEMIQACRDLAEKGGRVAALKRYRNHKGCTIEEARDALFPHEASIKLPEPAAIAISKRESSTKGSVEFTFGMDAFKIDGPHALYTEQQVREILAERGIK